ncbi:HAMP domain-containing sensor histidine kinase [Paenibacillus sp. BK720]|uniref:sensor histidine kinase n=1 Tax=Paenibacillus sp. BK720 TaxID=2587092 RepID=UPI00141E996E|nr:HAMP domain-containing sensor histidine kinase [Paenibacillus sp. BK720]NIK67005.1 signal transduction histidine kinase [Paenibacillus sp. BK720]
MVTKWRNRTHVVLYALLLVIGLSGPLTLVDQGSRYLHRDYFHTQEFRMQLEQFAATLNLFELNSISKQEAKSAITVEKAEIADYRNQLAPLTEQLNVIRDEYELSIQDALASGNSMAAEYYKAEKERKTADLLKLYQDDDRIAALVRENKENRIDSYYRIRETYRSEFNRFHDQFDYYLWNSASGIVHSSLSANNEQAARNAMSAGSHVYVTDYTIDITNSLHYLIGAHELLDASILPYQGWIAVPKNSPQQALAKQYRWEQFSLFAYVLAGSILLIVCSARLKRVMSFRMETGLWTGFYTRLPIDVRSIIFMGTAVMTAGILVNSAGFYPSLFHSPLLYAGKLLASFAAAAVGLALTFCQGRILANEMRSWSKVKDEWARSLLKRTSSRAEAGVTQIRSQVKDSFLYKSAGVRLFLFAFLIAGFGFAGGWAVAAYFYYGDAFYFLLALIMAVTGVAAFMLSIRQLGYLNRVAFAADELASGRMPDAVPQSGSGVLASLADNINALRQGVRIMQNEQAKNERLKTELITNVSHDLRTPLTSIITYAGLLKSGDATMEERAAYAEIIDQKSKRLKTMIDDLFEVSTMASGNAKLLLEQTDLVQLMQQALAEYKDGMDGSDIQFRLSLPTEPVYVSADGQKLWRVFDNLIGNMLKYSLAHTRAYISMRLTGHQEVAIIFKNVSKHEINDNADELLERFKRGDTSRHTEGSGLGLAIAKSIIDLHGGSLTLETDGDLFKATVMLKVVFYS